MVVDVRLGALAAMAAVGLAVLTPPTIGVASAGSPTGLADGGSVVLGAPPEPPPPPLLAFDEAQATSINGPALDADELRVCGADDGRRFLGEFLTGNPLNYKIPYRLADVVADNTAPTSAGGHGYLLSGSAASSVVGAGDFPFDHPFGSDFNMDVELDAPYSYLSQSGGEVVTTGQHVELSAGQFPHADVAPPADDTWESYSIRHRQNIQPGYVPEAGDRVIAMGRWVNDCGHPPFTTELHPLSFMANAHAESDRTVAHAFYAPYRETQLYHPDPEVARDIYDADRVDDPFASGFPGGLIGVILRIQDSGPAPYSSLESMEAYGMIEANQESPADWRVCAPPTSTGDFVGARWDIVARPGTEISVVADHAAGCVVMHTALGEQVTPTPEHRECSLPWPFLNEVAAAEAGSPDLDLQAEIKNFIAPEFQSRVDPAPRMNCYDPVEGPVVSPTPTGQDLTFADDLDLPFYGRIEVYRTDTDPTTTTTPSTGEPSTTTASTVSSSSSTSPAGQRITVTPGTVAAGATIDVETTGWTPSSEVRIALDDVFLGPIPASVDGEAAGSFTVPSTTTAGEHRVVATGTGSDGEPLELTATIVVTVPSSAGTLPATGAEVARWVLLGSLLVLGGLALLRVRLRHAPTS